ncbi:TauD/TfdA family dioxygenase [Streptomyces sp. NPDC056637]|uniref:TauD/TfdA family dioxygenase n=1 Tax=unclassified Streptomyces TaxID=2593676 RepID=UPI00363F0A0D
MTVSRPGQSWCRRRRGGYVLALLKGAGQEGTSDGRLAGKAHADSLEGKVLLDHLLRHASSPDYTIRFGRNPGDFVLWNNRATWPYAVDDYGDGAHLPHSVPNGPRRSPGSPSTT